MSEAQVDVLESLAFRRRASRAELIVDTGRTVGSVGTALGRLETAGLVQRAEGRAGRGVGGKWEATTEGRLLALEHRVLGLEVRKRKEAA